MRSELGGVVLDAQEREPGYVRPRVAVVHPWLHHGGASAVAAWTLQALQAQYDVSFYTFGDADPATINERFGTHLADGSYRVVCPPRRLPGRLHTADTLSQHRMARFVRSRDDDFDIAVCTSNEMDLGGGQIQYVHFPKFLPLTDRLRRLSNIPSSWRTRAYRSASARLSGFSPARARSNVTLTNSAWTAEVMRSELGLSATVIHPPVWSDFPQVPWAERSNTVCVIGRISPEKRLEDAIAIVDALRARGHDLALQIFTPDRRSTRYWQDIERSVAARDWASIEVGLDHAQLAARTARARYGLHCMFNEHFGIAVAELVNAGCVTFVHRSGGPPEIVGGADAATFVSVMDAVSTFEHALNDEATMVALRANTRDRRGRFSESRFCQEISGVVAAQLAVNGR